MVLMFVYGSLKKGYWNYYNYGLDKEMFVGNAKLHNAEIYDLGAFPAITPTDNRENVVYGEVYDVLNKETVDRITAMETGAGYTVKEKFVVMDNGELVKCNIFFMQKPREHWKKIDNGTWEVPDRKRI